MSKQNYYNFIKDGAGFNETEYFGPNIRKKKYIPNFDKEEDRKFSDGTIATIALVYLVNISKMANNIILKIKQKHTSFLGKNLQ